MHIEILMATYNGAAFLDEQLSSFVAQQHTDWSLTVSDDGSTDETQRIVRNFPNTRVIAGPRRGSAHNFLGLLANAQPGCVAVSDQDDAWFPDKLSRAAAALSGVPKDQPALYCSRTILADADLNPIKPARLHRNLSFRNAAVQNVVAGNTIVLNEAGTELARQGGTPDVPYHDWWLYLLFTGAGAHLIYDDEPTLYYRQHGSNELGENRTIAARTRRAALATDGTWGKWIDRNLTALRQVDHLLTSEHRDIVSKAPMLSGAPLFDRRAWLQLFKPFRQSKLETMGVYAAILSGKV